MKLIKHRKEERNLVIEVEDDDGRKSERKCKRTPRNSKHIERLIRECHRLEGQKITTTTYGDWPQDEWFNGIFAADEASEEVSGQPSEKLGSSLFDKKFASQTQQKIYGPPGTGKTTKLIDIVVDAVNRGIAPDEIGFISFTNAATEVARDRVLERFPEMVSGDFPYFSTLHSLATRVGGHTGKTLMRQEHFKKFDENIRCWMETTVLGDSTSRAQRFSHPILDKYQLSKSRQDDFNETISGIRLGSVIERDLEDRYPNVNIRTQIENYVKDFCRYKERESLMSFDDVIDAVVSDKFENKYIPMFDLLIIDEAQDLSSHLWLFAQRLIDNAHKAYIAGDDDQAIMEFQGASPKTFNDLITSEEDNILEQSWRVPLASRRYVEKKVMPILKSREGRVDKDWIPQDKPGYVVSSDITPDDFLRYVLDDVKSSKHKTPAGVLIAGEDASIVDYEKGYRLVSEFLLHNKINQTNHRKTLEEICNVGEAMSFDELLKHVGNRIRIQSLEVATEELAGRLHQVSEYTGKVSIFDENKFGELEVFFMSKDKPDCCLLYTSDAADE